MKTDLNVEAVRGKASNALGPRQTVNLLIVGDGS